MVEYYSIENECTTPSRWVDVLPVDRGGDRHGCVAAAGNVFRWSFADSLMWSQKEEN
jgi:hypothetical protein